MFSKLRVLTLLFIVSLCLGCGSTKEFIHGLIGSGIDNSIPPSELTDFIESTDLNNIWSENVGKGSDELFIKLVPAILYDKIFTADTHGNISALYADTGKEIWERESELSITGGPGAEGNLVMVGTSEGEVLSLDTETGDELWRSRVSSEILSPPIEADGIVVVRTIDGKIFALDAITGERLWIYDRTVPALTLRGTSTPVISNGAIIAGFDGGRVTALDLNSGKLIWETKVAVSRGRSELERMVDIDAQPLIIGEAIYVTTFQANVSAISIQNGQILWQRDISSHTELGADARHLYVTDDVGNVWALDRFSGSSVWKQDKLTHRQLTGPAILGERIIVGDLEGYIHLLDKSNGVISARTQIDNTPILTQPIVSNDMLFAYSSGGTLSAYSIEGFQATIVPTEISIEEETRETAEPDSEQESSFFGSIFDIFTGDGGDDDEDY